MTVPALSLDRSTAREAEEGVVVLGVLKTADGPRLAADPDSWPQLRAALAQVGATGAVDELRRLPKLDGTSAPIALIGLADSTPDALRYAAGSAARQLSGVDRLSLALPVETEEDALAVLEGAATGAYAFLDYRSAVTKRPPSHVRVLIGDALPDADLDSLIERATASATAVHTVRDLVNTAPSDLYPETFAEAAITAALGLEVELEVLDENELAAGGYGGILAVGSGSARPPRLVVVRYQPDGAGHHLALVGKGITFDSGGLSLKPAAGMVGMKYDMTGAATALAVVLAAASLRLPVRLTAWLCLAENMPSGSAVRPNDVLRMRNGSTVEVLNTDAEGRLVLADGIAAASEEHPDAIVDVATLTGAARVAMGDRTIAVMGDSDLSARVAAAGTLTGEPMWPMPLPAELRSVLDSDVADIANAKPGTTSGGMMLGGHFLKTFVGGRADDDNASIPWVHLDIANAANNPGGAYGFTPKGSTGAAVRALLALAEDFSRP